MNRTASTSTPPGTKVPWRDVYRLATLCGGLDADELDADTPGGHIAKAIGGLFPDLDYPTIHRLWQSARLDAAALGQLEAGDCHRWPLADMDPPPRLSRHFAAFENELADAVEFELRQVRS